MHSRVSVVRSRCTFVYFQGVVRLYDIPDSTFESDDDDDSGEDGIVFGSC